MNKNFVQLQNKELESIAGGTCYSKGTYKSLGCFHTPEQTGHNHPVITTAGNKCKLFKWGIDASGMKICDNCFHRNARVAPMYCAARSREYDPAK